MAIIIPSCVLFLFIAVYNVEGACVDKIDYCHEYPKQVCRFYPRWSRINCARTCRIYCYRSDHCPPDWRYSVTQNTCYKAIGKENMKDRKSWYGARDKCKAENGSLVLITDKINNFYLYTYLDKTNLFWMGIRNVDKHGGMEFKYVNGTSLGSYTNWRSGEPDNYMKRQHCVVLTPSGKWSDLGCLTVLPFICQRNITDDW